MDRWVGARRRAIQVSLDIEPHPSQVLSPSDFRTVQGFAERYLRDHQIPQELASRVKRFQKRRSKKRSWLLSRVPHQIPAGTAALYSRVLGVEKFFPLAD